MAAIANGSIQSVRIKTKRTYQHSEARQNLEVQETEKWLIRTYMARVETIKLHLFHSRPNRIVPS